MANAGRSRRCFRCKQRKVKCGEQRPSCDTCLARGEVCPGYAPTFEFRHEYDKPESAARSLTDSSPSSPKPVSDLSKRRKQRDLVLVHYGGGSRTFTRPSPSSSKTPDSPLRLSLTTLPADSTTKLRGSLTHLMDRRLPSRVRLDHYGVMFLDQLPSHLGYTKSLDHAVETLCLWHRNHVGMERDEVKFLKAQAKALASLRTDLESAALCKNSETLCAAIILAGIQTFVSTGHRNGIYALLRYRGPPRNTDADHDFYESLMLSAQGLAWNKSFEDNEQCFLESPEWQAKIDEALHHSRPLGQKYGIARKASPLIACFPGLVKDGVGLIAAGGGGPDDPEAVKLVDRIQRWRWDVMRPEPALCDIQDVMYRAVGQDAPRWPYSKSEPLNSEVLAYLCSFCASLIVTRRMLRLLDERTALELDSITRLTAEGELSSMGRLASENYLILLENDVPSLPFISSTLNALVSGVNQLDGLGSWQDIVNPQPLDLEDLDAMFDMPFDPALEIYDTVDFTGSTYSEQNTSARRMQTAS